MSTFLGIGAGPIQTGIFVSGAAKGGYKRIVLADVDPEINATVGASKMLTVNTVCGDSIISESYENIEIYNPTDPQGLIALKNAATEATAVCTALPATSFYPHIAPWLREAFAAAPDETRYVYTAENSTTAAHELEMAVGHFSKTHYLDTVIGKMSKVFTTDECDLPPLAPHCGRGHLVEEYNDIYTSSVLGVSTVGIVGLIPKDNLEPFEAAKLYAHNTSHFLLGILAQNAGCRYIDQASDHPEIISTVLSILLKECGVALNRKYGAIEEFVTPRCFTPFALKLVGRMVSPVLRDSVSRIVRDPQRKLGWNDRVIGAIRMCIEQNVAPTILINMVADIWNNCFGSLTSSFEEGFSSHFKDENPKESEVIKKLICSELLSKRTGLGGC